MKNSKNQAILSFIKNEGLSPTIINAITNREFINKKIQN